MIGTDKKRVRGRGEGRGVRVSERDWKCEGRCLRRRQPSFKGPGLASERYHVEKMLAFSKLAFLQHSKKCCFSSTLKISNSVSLKDLILRQPKKDQGNVGLENILFCFPLNG